MNLFSPSPERRRLRFSFQINNVKDPEPKLPEPPLGRTNRLAPVVGGGGYLSNLEFRVKSFFSKLSDLTTNRPGGLRQSRQLLKKPPKPVKLFLEETSKLSWTEILRRSTEQPNHFLGGGF